MDSTVYYIIIPLLLILFSIPIHNWIFYSQHKRRCNRYFDDNPEIIKAEDRIFNKLNIASSNFPQCSKCGSMNMQVWNVGPYEMEYRCTLCKKKFSASNYFSANQINSFYNDVQDLYLLLGKVTTIRNEHYDNTTALKAWQSLFDKIEFDYFNLRKGTPYVRAIEFSALGEITTPNRKNRKIPQRIKDSVWNRDNGSCVECGSRENLEFDHIIPHSKGGANTYRNIQLLCSICNKLKSDNIG